MSGAINILVALGFREAENGSLILNISASLRDLEARKLEITVGLELLRKRVEAMTTAAASVGVLDGNTPQGGTLGKNDPKKGQSQNPSKLLPPRPTTAAAVAVELSAAATKNSNMNEENESKSKKKNDSLFYEEKSKRLKAETALTHQKSLVQDLQSQISELQEIEQKNLTLRQGLTIDRLESNDKDRMKKQADTIGKDSFAFHGDSQKEKEAVKDTKGKTVESKQSISEKDKSKKSVGTIDSQQIVSLTHPATAGDTRLHVSSQGEYKKGMYIIIGNGMKAECRKISGFGSILIDRPLENSHPAGSTIRSFPGIEKSLAKIDMILAGEYIKDMLLTEILPTAVTIGSENIEKRNLNTLYKQRAMLKHSYTVAVQDTIPLGTSKDTARTLSVNHRFGKIFVVSTSGALSSIDFSLSSVELINLFENLARKHETSDLGESLCDKNELLRYIENSSYFRGALQHLAESRGFLNFELLLEKCLPTNYKDGDLLPWSVYCSALLFTTAKAAPIISIIDRETLLSKYGMDNKCVDLLVKLFVMIDYDDDENVTPAETKSSFADLDGHFTDFDVFTQAMARVVGTHTDEQRLSAVTYITVRAEYATLMHTLPGGLQLFGKQYMEALIDTALAEGGSLKSSRVSISDLMMDLPPYILDCTLLSTGSRLATILGDIPSPATRDLIIRSITGRVLVVNCPEREERVVESKSIDVVQVTSSSCGRSIYLLSRCGMVHLFDVGTSKVVLKRRVIWVEPPPQRSVEGNERFVSWRRDAGLDYLVRPGDSDVIVAGMHAKAAETINISARLASFVLSLPSANVASGIADAALIAVDSETGLIAVNCSASSGSICIHEPVSLRRIYRLKAPGSTCKDLSNAIQGISVGENFRGRYSPQMSEGVVSSMVLWARRSLLLCTVGASDDLHITSLLTGDTVFTLSGHTDHLSSLSISCSIGMIFTGSLDGTVRVWIADECIPHRLAAFGTYDDPSLHALEKKVTKATGLGTGTRQVLRNLSTQLSSRLRLVPHWRHGRMISFFDGTRHSKEPQISSHSVGVEVVFENGSVQIYANGSLLRNPKEETRAPLGPPLWSEQEAPLVLGQEVAIYEIDPDIAASICAREMGVPVMASQSSTQCAQLLTNLLNMRSDETADVLEAVGLHKNSSMSIFTLIRRVYKYPEKFSSRCDRLLANNTAPITSISFSSVSKLIVAIDVRGYCCVWDPCEYRVSLTVCPTSGRPAFIGSFPYSLVHKSNIMNGLNKKFSTGKSSTTGKSKSMIASVTSVSTLSVPSMMPTSFPVDRSMLIKGFGIDSSFNAADVTLRGFIYVMRDLSTCCVECSSFRPSSVAMDCPEQFMCLPGLNDSDNIQDLTKLQQLYLNRDDVLRIVYAVTCAHSTLDALVDDLRQYGVLQRGYTTTPSEQIEVICFERQKGWLEHSKELGSSSSLVRGVDKKPKSYTGIVISSTTGTGSSELRVALDFSNDIVCVQLSQVLSVFKSSADSSGRDGSEGGGLVQGSRVLFSPGTTDIQYVNVFEERCVQDSLMVSVSCVGADGVTTTSLFPVVLGRSSFPLPAHEVDLPLCDDTSAIFSNSTLEIAQTLLGRLSAYAYHHRSTRASWVGTFNIHQARIWETICSKSKKEKVDKNMELMTAFSSLNISAAAFAIGLYMTLISLRVSPSHPLVVCLDYFLGGQGVALFKSKSNELISSTGKQTNPTSTSTWKVCLENLQSMLSMRVGLLPEELSRESRGTGIQDVESFAISIDQVLATRFIEGTVIQRLGPVNVSIVSKVMMGKIEDTRGGAGSEVLSKTISDTDNLIIKLHEKNGSVLTTYLLQHWLTLTVKSHSKLLVRINHKATLELLDHLSALSLPLLVAVKDASPLSAPTVEQIERSFPEKISMAAPGQYSIIATTTFPEHTGSLFPGLKMEIIKGIKPRGNDIDTVFSFLSWTYTDRKGTEEGRNLSLLSAMTELTQLMIPLQKKNLIVVRPTQGVGFTGETGGAISGIIHEWDDNWQPLSVLVRKHKGCFRQGRADLFRLQATRLLDAMIELNDSGVVLRGLSPDTVILDDTGTKVRILLLPVAYDIDKKKGQSESDIIVPNEDILHAYIESSKEEPFRLGCVPSMA